MGYRRNDDQGRVVGFKDGQPVYKKINRGERDDKRRDGERRDGEKRYGDRERGGKDRESFKRPYNRKEGGLEQRGEGHSFDRGNRDERSYGRKQGDFRREYTGERREAPGSDFRSERRYEGAPRRFSDERIQRKADELERSYESMQSRPPRREKHYENLKPLPQDIPEVREEELPNIIMGRNPVKEAIKTGRSIDRILVVNEHDGSLNEILDLAYGAKLVVRNVDRSKLDEICMPFGHNGRPGNHQGIIAYVPEAQYCELSDILDYAKERGEHPFVVLLDGIEDPHNLGSIIRSAECAGAHGVVIPKRRSASVTATVVKTSAGATEHMKIAKVVNLPVAIERLKEAGVWVAGADMGGEPMYSADLKGPLALVVGAEGAGISRLVKEKCDYIVSVPLKGQMESLNASVAAAVIMFEKVRQEAK
jgi:23S rRNA (guanosine2251-2'-O)-methyltransferase